MTPTDATPAIVEVLERMLRRMKADKIRRAAEQLGQEAPYWVVRDTLTTNGVEEEARHLVHWLKAKTTKKRKAAAKRSP